MRLTLAAAAALLLTLQMLSPHAARAQEAPARPAPPPETDDEVERVSVHVVSIPVSVTDRDGRFAADLRAEDFTVAENGRAQTVSYFASVEQPICVLLLLDTSGSNPEPARATAEAAISPVSDPADPAVRRFRPGAVLAYNYQVYNAAAADASSGSPRLTEQARLFQSGVEVLTGDAGPVVIDPARGWAEGGMRLSPEAKPGEYVLQIVITDAGAKEKDARQAAQWIDFEIVK